MKQEHHLVISGAAEDKTDQYLAIDKLVKKINTNKIMKLMKKIKIFYLQMIGINNVEEDIF